jgi:hypothetical protein
VALTIQQVDHERDGGERRADRESWVQEAFDQGCL